MTIEIYSDGRKIKQITARHIDVTQKSVTVIDITGNDGRFYTASYTGEVQFELNAETLNVRFTDPACGQYIEMQCRDF